MPIIMNDNHFNYLGTLIKMKIKKKLIMLPLILLLNHYTLGKFLT